MILLRPAPDCTWRYVPEVPIEPDILAAILSALIEPAMPCSREEWDELPDDHQPWVGCGSDGVGMVCDPRPWRRAGPEREILETIADGIDCLIPGRYPVYHEQSGAVLDWFEVR